MPQFRSVRGQKCCHFSCHRADSASSLGSTGRTKGGLCSAFEEADARTRTEDPFITRFVPQPVTGGQAWTKAGSREGRSDSVGRGWAGRPDHKPDQVFGSRFTSPARTTAAQDGEGDQQVPGQVQTLSGRFTALPRLRVVARAIPSQATAERAATPPLTLLD